MPKKRKLSISEKKYKALLEKRRRYNTSLSKKEKKQLDDALFVKYCKCLKKFESEGDSKGYPICMNAVYKQRKIKPPKNAIKKCKLTFNKKITK
tara:strand:+ start:1447 stop:1728 length:282 start_codon:yes stop_codon:yes gene_type:complete